MGEGARRVAAGWWVRIGAVASAAVLVVASAGPSQDDAALAPATSLPPPTTPSPTAPPTTRTTVLAGTTSTSSSTLPASTSTSTTEPPPQPVEVTREIPTAEPETPPPAAPPPPWASSVTTTSGGYVGTSLGCASGTGPSSLDAFFAVRAGPLLGADYQHVVALGNGKYVWFFQDAFIDPGGSATRLDQAHFAHNVALLQDGACFTLLHRGTAASPKSFESGNGEQALKKWFWPMGGETFNGVVSLFWVEMVKDPYNPTAPDGLGWHPARTWLATYKASNLQRLSFGLAPNSSARPVYGYAVASDASYTYLFGNTFEQNLVREGGYWNGPHSATAMYLARVPLGQLGRAPEYRTADGWSPDPAAAVPFTQRFFVEYPMQPRFLGGQWVSVAKVDGYWGSNLIVEVANQPWGPWTTTELRGIAPRGGDPKMNTYHAHLMPWRTGNGSLVVTISQNARQMVRDAYPHPERYRIAAFSSGWVAAPPDPVPTTTTTSTTSTTSTTIDESSTTSSSEPTTSSSEPGTTSTSTSSTTTSSTSSTSSTTSTTTSSTPSTPPP